MTEDHRLKIEKEIVRQRIKQYTLTLDHTRMRGIKIEKDISNKYFRYSEYPLEQDTKSFPPQRIKLFHFQKRVRNTCTRNLK